MFGHHSILSLVLKLRYQLLSLWDILGSFDTLGGTHENLQQHCFFDIPTRLGFVALLAGMTLNHRAANATRMMPTRANRPSKRQLDDAKQLVEVAFLVSNAPNGRALRVLLRRYLGGVQKKLRNLNILDFWAGLTHRSQAPPHLQRARHALQLRAPAAGGGGENAAAAGRGLRGDLHHGHVAVAAGHAAV